MKNINQSLLVLSQVIKRLSGAASGGTGGDDDGRTVSLRESKAEPLLIFLCRRSHFQLPTHTCLVPDSASLTPARFARPQLTRLLEPALRGNARLVLVCTVALEASQVGGKRRIDRERGRERAEETEQGGGGYVGEENTYPPLIGREGESEPKRQSRGEGGI